MTLDAFDFEAWRRLAERDPQAFFMERERTISSFIRTAHPRSTTSLTELQAQIDAVRTTAGTPTLALRGLAIMMTDTLNRLAVHARDLNDEVVRLSDALKADSGPDTAVRADDDTDKS
jgi:hypothetical protein